MILKSHFDLVSLTELEAVVEDKLNIEINLAVKEMNEGFGIDDPTITAEPYFEKPKNAFDFTDSYTYSDFYNQYNGQNADDVLENVIDDAQRVIVHCNKGEGSYIKKSKNGSFDIC